MFYVQVRHSLVIKRVITSRSHVQVHVLQYSLCTSSTDTIFIKHPLSDCWRTLTKLLWYHTYVGTHLSLLANPIHSQYYTLMIFSASGKRKINPGPDLWLCLLPCLCIIQVCLQISCVPALWLAKNHFERLIVVNTLG